jgi:hypothetical protein
VTIRRFVASTSSTRRSAAKPAARGCTASMPPPSRSVISPRPVATTCS